MELMAVLIVISILVVITAPGISYLRARSQKVQCLSNLRSLHVAAGSYVQDNHQWPQITVTTPGDPANAHAWISALQPYELAQINWVCPAIQQALGSPDLTNPDNARVDYYATPFDTRERSPFQYSRQPWFNETADMHGNGQEIIFPDGHIEEAGDLIRSAQGKH